MEHYLVVFKCRGQKAGRDAFADPLDGPEWEGLVWAPVLAASIAHRPPDSRFPTRFPETGQGA